MDLTRASTIDPKDAAVLLRSFVQGERARALRVQRAAQNPEAANDEVEDAVQSACKSFLDEAERDGRPRPGLCLDSNRGAPGARDRDLGPRGLGRSATPARVDLLAAAAGL